MTFRTQNSSKHYKQYNRQAAHRDSDIFASQSSSDEEEETRRPTAIVDCSQSRIASVSNANRDKNHNSSNSFNALSGKILIMWTVTNLFPVNTGLLSNLQ